MRMRGNVHGDQKIARRVALHSLTLPAQSDLLALGDPGGDLDVERLTGRQPDALLASPDSLLQRHRHGDVDVQVEPDAAGLELERARPPGSAARAAAGIGEHAVEDVLEPAATHAARSATGAERIALETTGTTGAAASAATGKAGETRLALGVDLAAVELLALVLVAEDFIGGVDFGEALGRFWFHLGCQLYFCNGGGELSSAATVSACGFPNGRWRSCSRRPAASFAWCH